MRALTVRPGAKNSLALSDLPEPATGDGAILVESLGLYRLITRRVALEDFADGFACRPDAVKVVLELAK
jgi:hypothetical protein